MKIKHLAAAVSVAAIWALMISALPPADARNQAEPQDSPAQTLDQQNTLQYGLANLRTAFHDAGYSDRDASALAERSMNMMKGIPVDPFHPQDPVDAEIVLDPDSDPMLLIARVQMEHGGKTWKEAYEWAALVYLTANRIVDQDPGRAGLQDGCLAFMVAVSYCETVGGLNRKKSILVWLDAGCYEDVLKNCLPAQLPACVYPNVPTMDVPTKFNPAQCTLGIADGRCVSITIPDPVNLPAQIVPCANVIGCECLDEKYIQANCGTLNVRCCPANGCTQGCPSCP